MAIDPTTTTTIRVGQLGSAAFNSTDLVPHEVSGTLKKGTLQDLATFIGSIISVDVSVGFRAVQVNDGETLPATDQQEFILVGPGTYPNVGGGATITTTGALNALVSNGVFWFIGVEIPIEVSAIWGDINGVLSDQTDLNDILVAKADLVGGKVPNSQLPSYVDDVIEVNDFASLPSTGETGKIYVTKDTGNIYRWSGSAYIRIADESPVWGIITGTLSDQTDLQNALDGKFDVPTGDTTQYIAGDGSLVTFPVAGQAGTLVRLVLNNSGSTIAKGSVVYINGASGNKPTIAKAIATGDSTSAQTFGLVQTDITNNSSGYVVVSGDLIGLNTSAITEGTQLYLSSTTAGTYTTTKQVAPAHLVYIGVITRSHPTQGQIEVKIQNGYELDEIHDVAITSKANNQFLVYESASSLWKNKSLGTVLAGTSSQFVKGDGSLDSTTYLSGTVAIANGGTGATTADSALSNLGGTTVGKNIFTSTNPSPVTTAYLKVKPDNSVEWLEANAFRIAIGAGTGNGTVTSVEAVGSYGGLTLTGTVTGSGQITLGGTPTGTWPISVSGNAASVNTVQVSTNADFYLTFADANNGSPTSEFLYTIGSVKVNPSTGALTAGSFVKSGGTSGQFLKADGSIDSTSYQAALTNPVTGTGTTNYITKFTGSSAIGNSLIYDNGTNVGIGTTSPSAKLNVLGNIHLGSYSDTSINTYEIRTNKALFSIASDGVTNGNGTLITYSWANGGGGPLKFNNASGEVMRLSSGGNVGIGTTSPSTILSVEGTNQISHKYNGGGGSSAPLYIGQFDSSGNVSINNAANADLWIGTNNSRAMTIKSGGNVLIGTTANTYVSRLVLDGAVDNNTLECKHTGTGSVYNVIFVNGNGYVGDIRTNGSSTSFNTTSDYRLKQDFKSFNGLDLVSKIKVYDYAWKVDNSRMNGVIAHELQEVVPYAVTGEKDAEQMQSVDYSKLVPILVQAIQELKAEIEILKNK